MQTRHLKSKLLLTLPLVLLLNSCSTRRAVSLNWEYDVVKVGPNVTGKAYIWNTKTKDFELSANDIKYPEGAVVTLVKMPPVPAPPVHWWQKIIK